MFMWCGMLKLAWVGKSVASGFLVTSSRLMVKTRLLRLIHDRQYKYCRKKGKKHPKNQDYSDLSLIGSINIVEKKGKKHTQKTKIIQTYP